MTVMGGMSLLTKAESAAVIFDREANMTFAYYKGQPLGHYEFSAEKGLMLDLNIPESFQKMGLGREIFQDAMKMTKADKFTATWIESLDYPDGISTNLRKYREARAGGFDVNAAAWETPSGGYARDAKFTNVSVRYLSNGVEATFTK